MHSRVFTGRPTPDSAQLSVRFKDGSLVNIFASFCTADSTPYSDSLIISFENGVVFRNAGPCALNDNGTIKLQVQAYQGPDTKPAVEIVSVSSENRSGTYQWEAFYRAINGEKLVNEVTPEQIADGLRIIKTMSQADKSGKLEKV